MNPVHSVIRNIEKEIVLNGPKPNEGVPRGLYGLWELDKY